MAKNRTGAERVQTLTRDAIERSIQASGNAGSMAEFYSEVGMLKPSWSYFVRDANQVHSLKAVVAYALQQEWPEMRARNFPAAAGARHLRQLGFQVEHGASEGDRERERVWTKRLSRPEQAKFREKLIAVFGQCVL